MMPLTGSPHEELGVREIALLDVLHAAVGRVVTRTELARAAGLHHAPRRVDVHLVGVRRHLGEERLRNVRGRGWMLTPAPPAGPLA